MTVHHILFVSYYSHQEEFFEPVKEELNKKDDYQVFHLTKKDFSKGIINQLFSGVNYNKDVEQIISYSYLQFKYSREKSEEDLVNRFYHKILKLTAKKLYQYYFQYFKEKEIDLVIVWNGYRVQVACALQSARDLGLKTLIMENGFFPGTIVMDEQGVNAANSLRDKDKSFYEQVEVDQDRLASFKDINLEQRQLRGVKNQEHNPDDVQLPEKFIFLPFQVLTDTQIIINSPQIKSMEQLMEVTYRALQKFNKRYNEDFYVVAKEHPSDYNKRDYSALKEKYKDKNVQFLVNTSAEKLIDLSEAIVTINSTVGIEGLLKHKPVITLGDAFYNVEGLVYHVEELSKLDQALSGAIYEEVNHELIDKFLYHLRFNYLVSADKKKKNKEDIVAVIEKIGQTVTGG